MESQQRKEVECVVAMDFGTTYSGYAFSSVDDFKENKLEITLNQAWNAGTAQLISYKTPTTLLLTESGELKSFGYVAERDYENILLDKNEKESNYMYFHRFKMALFSGKVNSTMMLKDIRGVEHSALQVFSKSIKALRVHCIETMEKQHSMYDEDQIKWAITVPAIWSDEAKMFMRQACETAGIPKHRLIMALEPEVASIYCQLLQMKIKEEGLHPHSKYLIVDLGGGTADISGYEILENHFFKQVCRATGKNCGGTSVDKEFFYVLSNILGSQKMEIFRTDHTLKFLQLSSDFESAKRNIRKDQKEIVNIRMPGAFDNLVPDESFEKLVKKSEYADRLSVTEEMLRLNPEFAKSLFTKTINNIVRTIRGILQGKNGLDISEILLVGGFAESNIVQEEVKSAFPEKNVNIPKDPTLAVLKGAVVYGHRPDVVTTRITQFTYGRKIKPLFKADVHDSRRKVHVDEEPRCDGVFELLVAKGTAVPIGKTVSRPYHTISRNQEYIRVSVYKSGNDQPKYIDEDGCTLVGECSIPVVGPSDNRREITVNFEFGDTEIIIIASGRDTRQVTKETFLLA